MEEPKELVALNKYLFFKAKDEQLFFVEFLNKYPSAPKRLHFFFLKNIDRRILYPELYVFWNNLFAYIEEIK